MYSNNFKNHNLKIIKVNTDSEWITFKYHWICSNCNIKFKTMNKELTNYLFYLMDNFGVNFLNRIESCDEYIIKSIIK
jgi:hypothetical protein